METHVAHEELVGFTNKAHKNIIIFHVTSMSTDYDAFTNSLAIKMDEVAKKHNIDVTVKMDSASKIDSIGKEADIILLSPVLFEMEEEVKATYPDKIIKVIDQKDYGFLNAENVLITALS